ncbi:MAG: SMI1/KNR4 family protein, partial [Gammaproteobacteria bacterium]
ASAAPSIQEFLRSNLNSLSVVLEADGSPSLLYQYTVNGRDVNYYRGRLPVSSVPERLRSVWERVPVALRAFYLNLHDGWTFLPADSMGPLPLADWAFLSDDKFDIDVATSRAMPADPCTVLTVFHNGAGDYLCLNFSDDSQPEATGLIWWHEDPSNPEHVDFWGVLDVWIGIFLEDADRSRSAPAERAR